ncbi:MAG TPA: UrcA family protein [Thermoanaerobaculia bacterium]|nr:UrcA family protein [Thermoanaerobaculia bacterium]
MKTSIKLLLPVVAASLTLAGLATPASAAARGNAADVPSIIVQYDAATLGTRAGVKNLRSRLFMAAQSVCKQLDSRVLGLREDYDQCVRDAVRRSVADVGNANLTNYIRYGTLTRVVAAN